MKLLSLSLTALRRVPQALTLGLGLLILSASPLKSQELCRQGLHYGQTSPQSWGKGHPVLTAVYPWSPAAEAGLRAGDVLTAIDGVSTLGLTTEEVRELLIRPVTEHLFTLQRLGSGAETRLLRPYCKGEKTITERELAVAFSGYSSLDGISQPLSYPFTFRGSATFPWEKVKTFSFAPSAPGSEAVDKPIYAQVAQLLEQKGLRRVESGADVVIEAFYSLQPSADSRRDDSQPDASLRYDAESRSLQILPLLPPTSTAGQAYDLQFSLQFTAPVAPTQILWSAEAKERLSEAMTLPAYVADALPVLLHAFPYMPQSSPVAYRYEALRYLYTGIVYDMRDLSRIADVDEGSPAFRAGLRTGDRVRSINGKPFGISDPKRLSEAYKSFISETFRYRQTAELAPGLRPWETKSYGAVRKALEKSPEESVFSYLFFFRPWINDSEHTLLLFDIERQGQAYSLSLVPELRDESTLIPE